jgi:CBS domain containing-hemolysin-like protein
VSAIGRDLISNLMPLWDWSLSTGATCCAYPLLALAQATVPATAAATTSSGGGGDGGNITFTLLAWTFIISTVASLLFSTLSYALRTISRVQLEEALIVRRRTRALEDILHSRFDLALSASILRLICNTAGILAVGAYFLILYYSQPHPFKVFGLTVLVTVPVMLIFSVAIPQAWAKYAGEPLLAFCWPLLKVAHWLLWPVVRVLNVFDEIVKRLAGVSLGEEPETAAEKVQEEILSVVAEGTAGGAVDEEQKKMIEGVISFRDLQVGQIMTPRTEIIAVEVNTPVLDVRDRILNDGLSRVPVYEGTLDNIVGIVNAKDLLQFVNIAGGSAGEDEEMELRRIMRRPLFVPRTKPLRDLLKEFRLQGHHMAVVLDEYGGTSGLVTTEDIVEEIVGDIVDEYEPHEPEGLLLKRLDARTVEVDARMHISDFNHELGLALPEDGDFQTVGGFVISTRGVIPGRGDRLEHEGLTVTVLEAEPRRIRRLRIELPGPPLSSEPPPPPSPAPVATETH